MIDFEVGDKFKIVEEPSNRFPELYVEGFVDSEEKTIIYVATTFEEFSGYFFNNSGIFIGEKNKEVYKLALPILFLKSKYGYLMSIPASCCEKLCHKCTCDIMYLMRAPCKCGGI